MNLKPLQAFLELKRLHPDKKDELEKAFQDGVIDEGLPYSPWGIYIKHTGEAYKAYNLGWSHAHTNQQLKKKPKPLKPTYWFNDPKY